jgi:hypothetical protein
MNASFSSTGGRARGGGTGNHSTSGPFWARYREDQEKKRALRAAAAAAGIRLCIFKDCMEPVAVRSGRQGNPARYCVEHTPTCGSEQMRARLQAQERAQERARARKAAQRARHAATLERMGEGP